MEEFLTFRKLDKEIVSLKNLGKTYYIIENIGAMEDYKEREKIMELKWLKKKAYMKSIIFLGMYLEAFIFDYGVSKLGDTYFKENLEKLDVRSKWIIVPKLISGNEISREDHRFGYLKKIIRERNSFVHNKSKKVETILKKSNNENYGEPRLKLEDCFNCLGYLMSQINTIDKGYSPTFDILPNLRKVLNTL